MLSLYTVLLTLHILLVIGWLGAGIAFFVISRQAIDNPAWGPIAADFGRRWFPAVSGLTGLVGILLWIDGPWGAGDLWIILAVIGWLASSALGATQLGPNVEKWGTEGDTVARDTYLRLAQIDLVILTLVVADMVIKPGL